MTRRWLLASTLGAALDPIARLRAETGVGFTGWVSAAHAQLRLIDAGPETATSGIRLMGIDVRLDPEALTYWRSPGEAGVPPTLSFAGSTNVADATLLFPAPSRYDEEGSEAIGYKNAVVFPVRISPTDPTRPVKVRTTFNFAICDRQCVPAQARFTLDLDADPSPEAQSVRTALARVPVLRAVGEAGSLMIVAIEGSLDRGDLAVLVKAEDGDQLDLFVEAPDFWYFQVEKGLQSSDGGITFRLKAVATPGGPRSAPVIATLTLVGADQAIMAVASLDVAASSR